MQLGRMWLKMMRRLPKPATRADSTYSDDLTASTWPRVRRANRGQPTMAKAKMMFRWLDPKAAMMAMATIKKGKDIIISVRRMRIISTMPPK